MPKSLPSLHSREKTLRTLFRSRRRQIGEGLALFGIALDKKLRLDEDCFDATVQEFAELQLFVCEKNLDARYGVVVAELYISLFAVMKHLPVTSDCFDDSTQYDRRLANAYFAVAVAFDYLMIGMENGAPIIRRLVVYLTQGGVPDRLEANLAALRWFYRAHVRRSWITGVGRLRDVAVLD